MKIEKNLVFAGSLIGMFGVGFGSWQIVAGGALVMAFVAIQVFLERER